MTTPDDTTSADEAALAISAFQDDASEAGGRNGPAQRKGAPRKARVDRLIRDKEVADALAQTSAAQAQALRQRLQNAGRPQDYRTPEDYTRAVAEQAVREVGAEILARQAEQAREIASRAAYDAWGESTAAFRERVPDFDEVAHNPNLAVTPIMAEAIRETPLGAEIAYFLGKNPGEAARLAALPPVSQVMAIARLEARLDTAQSAISRAPEPIGALTGRGGSAAKPLDQMSFDEYRRARGF
ncbi:hypothetical protein KKP04_08700 [Rhodomicrobium sp. Az07]|uniref:hypothetical protein n=1 Tax=Rhodomicrobium sp. Az07 TaxID=2839034 RepID=UPI001BE9E014|nr:hypothetical protein [Rhodomicrobium sp. Az07]MBT3070945.1 hypothetical protein [Rhodomicrobium sp. Az07]